MQAGTPAPWGSAALGDAQANGGWSNRRRSSVFHTILDRRRRGDCHIPLRADRPARFIPTVLPVGTPLQYVRNRHRKEVQLVQAPTWRSSHKAPGSIRDRRDQTPRVHSTDRRKSRTSPNLAANRRLKGSHSNRFEQESRGAQARWAARVLQVYHSLVSWVTNAAIQSQGEHRGCRRFAIPPSQAELDGPSEQPTSPRDRQVAAGRVRRAQSWPAPDRAIARGESSDGCSCGQNSCGLALCQGNQGPRRTSEPFVIVPLCCGLLSLR